MKFKILSAICLSLASISFSTPSAAFEVQPMRHSIFPDAGKNSSILTVKNTRGKPLPVELLVQKRIYGEDGQESRINAEEDFVIFPFQALIEPGASQSFRFQYVGEQQLTEEAAYTINVREVPVDIEEGFSGLRYVYNFGVVVYVEKSEVTSKLQVNDIKREGQDLNIKIENLSPSFARLTNDRFTIVQGDSELKLEGDALTSVIDKVVVPPNSILPVTLNLTDLNLSDAEIKLDIRETSD